MGRRKIEIAPIKDDRNRSVTFLKRKGGLFKKAHELSVLCSVDVAVIIFGHNKKLYEFSSGDIQDTIGRYQYYGNPHEHKGPSDFSGKKDMDDDEDDDMGSVPPESPSSHEHQIVPPQLPNQHGYEHIRQPTHSASPPMSNGVPFHPRHSTPQPPMVSRPASRSNVRRTSSNLVPPNHPSNSQAPPSQNGFAYMPHPPIYNPQAGTGMPIGPPQGQPNPYQYPHPPPPHQPNQSQFMQDRRSSMPPVFPQQERPQILPEPSPPQSERHLEHPPPPKPMPAKGTSRSIFTPIDASRSLLAQHWGNSTTAEPPRSQPQIKSEVGPRSVSVDVGSVARQSVPPPPPIRSMGQPPRNTSIASVPENSTQSRANSIAQKGAGARRPTLKVHIPSGEQSDGGSATAESSPRESGGTTGGTPAKAGTDGSHSSGVVLPPPSPSASAILSAGAQGPPNPFARPHPPNSSSNNNQNQYSMNNSIETPISALPSRFMADNLLPSPSSFYPDWGFGRAGGDSNMLPSPLNFQTPIVGPQYLRDEQEGNGKRKSPDGESSDGGPNKRVKA
ncbi:MAG: hypothetical protein M1827_005483 [Pycnora praestabilis]|nr:MAG: hypothetical protein M1827_005483 [Pycnora praestabilis]